MARYRKWMQGATALERWELIHVQDAARALSVQEACYDRLDNDLLGLCDCTDVHVVSFSGRWYRSGGNMFCRCRVITGPERRIHTFFWRTSVHRTRRRSVYRAMMSTPEGTKPLTVNETLRVDPGPDLS